MGYGTSLGTAHEDELSAVLEPMTAKEVSDRKEINANEASGDFQSRFGGIDIRPINASTMPLEASRKLTDAFKSSGGTNVPGNGSETKVGGMDPEGLLEQKPPRDSSQDIYVNPYVTITPEDIDTGITVGLSAGPGTMAGVKSISNLKGVDKSEALSNLGHAQVLEASGVHPDDIWSKTGFGRGTDGRWRYEIDDSKSSLDHAWYEDKTPPKPDWSRVKKDETVTKPLSEILAHPDLYRAYPHLKNVRVKYDPAHDSTASWNGLNTITLGHPAVAGNNQHGIIMHEVQHAIQDEEGFARGGAPGQVGKDFSLKYDTAANVLAREGLQLVDKWKAKGVTQQEWERMQYIKKVMEKYQEYKAAGNESAREYYMRLAGEAEARNTDTRLFLNAMERRQILPRSTEDINKQLQIPVDRPSLTTAYGVHNPKTGKLIK